MKKIKKFLDGRMIPRSFAVHNILGFISGLLLLVFSANNMVSTIRNFSIVMLIVTGIIAILVGFQSYRYASLQRSLEKSKLRAKDVIREIETPRLILNLLTLDDADRMHEYHNAPEVTRYQTWEKESVEQICNYIINSTNGEFKVPGRTYYFAIRLKENRKLIGDWTLHFPYDDMVHNQVEKGTTLAPAYQGKGYSIEANLAILDFCFYTLNIHRIYAYCDARNRPAIVTIEKYGLKYEGLLRDARFFKGQWVDYRLYGILERDWREFKASSRG